MDDEWKVMKWVMMPFIFLALATGIGSAVTSYSNAIRDKAAMENGYIQVDGNWVKDSHELKN